MGVSRNARIDRLIRNGVLIFVGWLAVLVALFFVGDVLSRLTLRSVQRASDLAAFEPSAGERGVRALYRTVIALVSLYFYVSIPVLIVLVTVLAAGILYLLLSIGHVPLQLLLIVGVAAIYTLVAVFRSILTRVREEEPGRPVSREEAPGLWSVAEAVAERVGERPVDAICLTPGPEVGVTERGGLLARVRGTGRRLLILGLGSLAGFTQRQLAAVLAHEYGHFSNRDTAGGDLANHVSCSIYRMAHGLAVRGQATWYNPVWWFLKGFERIFLRITLGASRLQEILADRHAAFACGPADLSAGLRNTVRQAVFFDAQFQREARAATSKGRRLRNLYALPPIEGESEREAFERAVEEAMTRPTSPYDSHPAMRDRLDLIGKLVRAGDDEEDTSPEAWLLLPNAFELQEQMTALVDASVRKQHVMPVPTEERREPAEGDAVALAPSISESCTRCAHGRERSARESWCELRCETVPWNGTCDGFEAAGGE